MKYSTENELDSLKPTTMGNIQASSLDGMIDDVFGDYMEPIKQTTQVILLGALAAAAIGGYFRIRPLMLQKKKLAEELKEREYRTAIAEQEFNDSVEQTRRKKRKKKWYNDGPTKLWPRSKCIPIEDGVITQSTEATSTRDLYTV